MTIAEMLKAFAAQIETRISEEATTRVRTALAALANEDRATFETFPRPAARKTIANRRSLLVDKPRPLKVAKKARRKGPIQLCPVPRCTGRAAPSLGMVCIKHRDVSKRLIKKYREQRRARKAK